MTILSFTKMHGSGNDFIVINALDKPFTLAPNSIAKLASRRFGIGFDQLLLVEKPTIKGVDFAYRIFNSDGSQVAQCGNGARCFMRFIRMQGLTDKKQVNVETHAGTLTLKSNTDESVTVGLGRPVFEFGKIPMLKPQKSIEVLGKQYAFQTVNLGNPHAVIWVPSLENLDIKPLAKQIQASALFPESVNVGFAQRLSADHIKLRVYERGAGETLACGSGACAAVVVGIQNKQLNQHVNVALEGGNVTVEWSDKHSSVYLTGPAQTVFVGQADISKL